MTLAPGLQLRTGQSLVMTPQLQRAIHLLTLTNLELHAVVADAMADNPLLDEGVGEESSGEPSADADAVDGPPSEEGDAPAGPRLDASASPAGGEAFDFDRVEPAAPSLADHLLAQAGQALSGPELTVASHLVALLDEAGYLLEPLDGIATRLGVPPATAQRALTALQGFDPPGVGARDLAECLALQLREVDRCDPAMERLLAHLPLLAQGALPKLRRLCGVDEDDLADMIREVRACDPRPGLRFGADAAHAVVPDLFVTRTSDGWSVELNAATLPRPVVDRAYYLQLKAGCAKAERAWLDERLADATWLIRTLDGRQRTILKVAGELVRRQDGFFRHGVGHLRPLTLAQVADAVGVHETTVSRVTKGKHLQCARGLFELKWFFTGGVGGADGEEGASAASVKAAIRQLVAAETVTSVLSDDQLMTALAARGFALARRTVAKYREAEGIGSSVARRRRFRLDG